MQKPPMTSLKTKLKAYAGFIFKGAKWFIKVRYGIDVDEVSRKKEMAHDDGTTPIGDDVS